MTIDNRLFLIVVIILVMLEDAAIYLIRDALLDMVIGNRNKKSAQKIYQEQTIADRFLLFYIKPHLKKYKEPYERIHKLYIATLAALLPKFILIAVGYYINYNFGLFIAFLFVIYNVLLHIILRIFVYPQGFNTCSKYRQK